MTRDEAKQLMRLELERDLPPEKRNLKVYPVGGKVMSANEMMEEIEAETKLGKVLLDDYIDFKDGFNSGDALSTEERAHIVQLMEADLQVAPVGWADEVIFSDDKSEWTPNMIMKEVRAETPFGLRYMRMYYSNHKLLEGLLGANFENKPVPQSVANLFDLSPKKKNTNDKAN